MPLPEGPGVAVSVNYIGPLRVTPQGNNYILLITDRFSRRADLFPVTGDEFTGKGAANILVNKYIPLWGYPRAIFSDNRLQCFSKLTHKLYTSCWECVCLPQAPIILAETEELSG